MSAPQKPRTVARDLMSSRRHVSQHERHRAKSCPNPPSTPTGVTLTSQATEARTHLRFTLKVKWNATTTDTQGHKTDIHHYVVQIMAVDTNGNPVEFEDTKPRIREYHKDVPKQTDLQDSYSIITPEVPRPKSWYWQARVEAIDEKGCASNLSNWTPTLLPWQGADPKPPVPSGVLMTFDNKTRTRHDRVRAIVQCNEVANFDYPDSSPGSGDKGHADHEDDVRSYVFQLQHGNLQRDAAGRPVLDAQGRPQITWDTDTDGNPVYKTQERPAKDSDADTVKKATFEHLSVRYWYRVRVRTIDRFNRRGDFSNWSPSDFGVTPSDRQAPPTPVNVDLNMNTHQARVQWDEIIDSETGLLHEDVAFFRVELSQRSDFATIYARNPEVVTHHAVFKVSKPHGRFYARVRSEDASGNASPWSNVASDTPRKPNPPNSITLSYFTHESKKWDKAKAAVQFLSSSPGEDDVTHYEVELESSATSDFTGSTHRWQGRVHQPETQDDGTLEPDIQLEFIHTAKRTLWYRTRVRTVDKDNQKSVWAPGGAPANGWSAGVRCGPQNASTLPVPANVVLFTTTRGVGVKWNHPIDGDGLPDESVDYFQVQVGTDPGFGSGTVMEDDNYVNSRHKVYNVDSSWSNQAGPYYVQVRSRDHMGNSSTWVTSATALAPGKVVPDKGSITDPNQFAGATVRPLAYVAALPTDTTVYPVGSIVILSTDNKQYRRIGAAGTSADWTPNIAAANITGQLVAGQLAANSVVATTIQAGAVGATQLAASIAFAGVFVLSGAGGAFRTDLVPNARIEMSKTDGPDYLSFINGSGGRVRLRAIRDATGHDIIDLITGAQNTDNGTAIRFGGASVGSKILNNGAIDIGDPSKQVSGSVGVPDANTVRLYYDATAKVLKIKFPGVAGTQTIKAA